jgi:hypothetical protein
MTNKAYARKGRVATPYDTKIVGSHKNQLHRPSDKTSRSDIICPYSFELYVDEVAPRSDRVSTVTSTFSATFREVVPQAGNSQKPCISRETSTRGNERDRRRNGKGKARASRAAPSVSAGNDPHVVRANGRRRNAAEKKRRAFARTLVDRERSRNEIGALSDRHRLDAMPALWLANTPSECRPLPSVQSAAGGAQ